MDAPPFTPSLMFSGQSKCRGLALIISTECNQNHWGKCWHLDGKTENRSGQKTRTKTKACDCSLSIISWCVPLLCSFTTKYNPCWTSANTCRCFQLLRKRDLFSKQETIKHIYVYLIKINLHAFISPSHGGCDTNQCQPWPWEFCLIAHWKLPKLVN